MQTAIQPVATEDAAGALGALLNAAAVSALDSTAWIRVTGSDRVRWLNGMVTNSIQDLAPGQGCYNFVLNAQGRILGDLTAFLLEDSILLETGREQVPALLAHFNRFIIMDDVELADVSDERIGVLIAGPYATRVVQELGGAACSAPTPAGQLATNVTLKQTAYRGAPVYLIQAYSPLFPRFEVWANSETIAQISTELASLPTGIPQDLEHLRILEGTPRYGVDIRNNDKAHDLPQETNQTRALHFAKGCYLGQEIVERIRSRGNVHRTFAGFRLEGALPEAGAVVTVEGKAAGEFTSVSSIPLSSPFQLALGYIRREALERGLPLTYPGGVATPVPLPYSIP